MRSVRWFSYSEHAAGVVARTLLTTVVESPDASSLRRGVTETVAYWSCSSLFDDVSALRWWPCCVIENTIKEVITKSDVIVVVGGHSPLGQAVITSATSRGLHVVAVVEHTEGAVTGCETLYSPYWSYAKYLDPESVSRVISERYQVVHHLVVAPDVDPFVKTPRTAREARKQLSEEAEIFKGLQKLTVTAVSSLVSPYGSVALAMPPRLTQDHPYVPLFSTMWLPQVEPALHPRLVYLISPGPIAGDTWLAAAASDTASTTLYQDRTAKARLDAIYGSSEVRNNSNNRRSAPDFYEILGVTPTVTSDQIRQAFLNISKRTHPDAGGNSGLFRLVCDAYETLSDPTRRAAYDLARS